MTLEPTITSPMPVDYCRTARHLTGAELDRLLSRYDLSAEIRRYLARHEDEEAWYLFEVYCEQMADYGRATRRRARLEAHHIDHPLYGPWQSRQPGVYDPDDVNDIPF